MNFFLMNRTPVTSFGAFELAKPNTSKLSRKKLDKRAEICRIENRILERSELSWFLKENNEVSKEKQDIEKNW